MKRTIAIIGGGASALMLASELNTTKFHVTVYEGNAALGRKFLVAGDGGLNLTHSEDKLQFVKRYTPPSFIEKAFKHFSNHDFIIWLSKLGVETYVGSSGRVFPKRGMKPVAVLNAFLNKIKENNVEVRTKHKWLGFSDDNALFFEKQDGLLEIKSDFVIYCLGGASWPVTGSTGHWANHFQNKNIQVEPFLPSNCAVKINWDPMIVSKLEGRTLKNIAISCANKMHLGEVVITKSGMEGSGIYPLSPQIRQQLAEKGIAEISIDFKPNVSCEKIEQKLQAISEKKNYSENVKIEMNLTTVQMQLLKSMISKADFLDVAKLAKHLKAFQLTITGTAGIEEAISTVGGIALVETDANFQLKKMPNHYVIGEMLDFDAPTGGYLLQSCFSMGYFLAGHLNQKPIDAN